MLSKEEINELRKEFDKAFKAINSLESILIDLSKADIVRPGTLFNYYRALIDLKEAIINIKNRMKV